jgi:hypothetical protein
VRALQSARAPRYPARMQNWVGILAAIAVVAIVAACVMTFVSRS